MPAEQGRSGGSGTGCAFACAGCERRARAHLERLRMRCIMFYLPRRLQTVNG